PDGPSSGGRQRQLLNSTSRHPGLDFAYREIDSGSCKFLPKVYELRLDTGDHPWHEMNAQALLVHLCRLCEARLIEHVLAIDRELEGAPQANQRVYEYSPIGR